MPCYRFRFAESEMLLCYYGHALPPPVVKIILRYAYEMTVLEDTQKLHNRLGQTLSFLRNFKQTLAEHLRPYEILNSRDTVAEHMNAASKKLCHVATVNLVTAMNPKPKAKRRRSIFTIHTPQQLMPRNIGFVLPEMQNYV